MALNYATQMDAARKGIVTSQMKAVAAKENMDIDQLMDLIAKGQVVIPANVNHTSLDPNGIGRQLKTKINVNLGVSRDCRDLNVELDKVMDAVNLGAEAIMDLSSHGDTQPFRRKLTSECPAMIGTVPVYDSVIHYQRDLGTLTARDFIDVVRLHAEDGVDFVTLHCGLTKETVRQVKALIYAPGRRRNIHNTPDARLRKPRKQLLPVTVKSLVVIMCMCIKYHLCPLLQKIIKKSCISKTLPL